MLGSISPDDHIHPNKVIRGNHSPLIPSLKVSDFQQEKIVMDFLFHSSGNEKSGHSRSSPRSTSDCETLQTDCETSRTDCATRIVKLDSRIVKLVERIVKHGMVKL